MPASERNRRYHPLSRLPGLQGARRPSQIVSLRSYPSEPAAVARPSYSSQIEVDFSPSTSGTESAFGGELDTGQWQQMIGWLGQLSGQPAAATTTPTSLPQQP
jgi:hypothetical protein